MDAGMNEVQDFIGRAAFVTVAARGIGRAGVRAFARWGAAADHGPIGVRTNAIAAGYDVHAIMKPPTETAGQNVPA